MEITVISLFKSHLYNVNTLQMFKKILKSKSDYKEIGIRYGEKMHETLVSEEEMLKQKMIKTYIIKTDKKIENFESYFFKGKSKRFT